MPYTVIMETRYLFGFLAAEAEREILNKYKKHKYQGTPFLESGNTELFTKDVLRLDKTPVILSSTLSSLVS